MLAALALWLAQTAIEIVGDVDCPSPAVINRKLEALSPSAVSNGIASAGAGAVVTSPPPRPTVRLSRAASGALEIVLTSDDGRWLAERSLAAGSGCQDLAAAVAVVIATWTADLDPLVPERVDLPRPFTPVTAIDSTPLPDAEPPTLALVHAPLGQPPRPFAVRIGALASSTGGNWAAGLRASGWLALWGDRVGLGAVLGGTLPRSETVGSVAEAARWTRGYFAAGPEIAVLTGEVVLNGYLQGAMALLHVAGSGLDTTASDTTVQFGGSAGVWLAWRRWRVVWPWIGADLLAWPSREHLRIAGLAAQGTLPRLEGQLAGGLGFGLFP